VIALGVVGEDGEGDDLRVGWISSALRAMG
jgi:hypothetical protein